MSHSSSRVDTFSIGFALLLFWPFVFYVRSSSLTHSNTAWNPSVWWHDLLIMSVCLSLSFQSLYNLRISSDVLNTAGLTLAGTTYIQTLFQTLKKSDWLDHWRSTLIAQRYLRYCCQILTKCDEWFLALFSNVYINYIIGFRESVLLKVGI